MDSTVPASSRLAPAFKSVDTIIFHLFCIVTLHNSCAVRPDEIGIEQFILSSSSTNIFKSFDTNILSSVFYSNNL